MRHSECKFWIWQPKLVPTLTANLAQTEFSQFQIEFKCKLCYDNILFIDLLFIIIDRMCHVLTILAVKPQCGRLIPSLNVNEQTKKLFDHQSDSELCTFQFWLLMVIPCCDLQLHRKLVRTTKAQCCSRANNHHLTIILRLLNDAWLMRFNWTISEQLSVSNITRQMIDNLVADQHWEWKNRQPCLL